MCLSSPEGDERLVCVACQEEDAVDDSSIIRSDQVNETHEPNALSVTLGSDL